LDAEAGRLHQSAAVRRVPVAIRGGLNGAASDELDVFGLGTDQKTGNPPPHRQAIDDPSIPLGMSQFKGPTNRVRDRAVLKDEVLARAPGEIAQLIRRRPAETKYRSEDGSPLDAIAPTRKNSSMSGSAEDASRNFSMHIGQPEVSTLGAVNELLVVDTERSQHGGMEVVNVHFLSVIGILVAQFICRAPGQTRLDTGSGHPD